jgi:hypothetical protein
MSFSFIVAHVNRFTSSNFVALAVTLMFAHAAVTLMMLPHSSDILCFVGEVTMFVLPALGAVVRGRRRLGVSLSRQCE